MLNAMLLIIATLEVSLDPEKIVLVVITAQLALINLQLKSALQVVIAPGSGAPTECPTG